MSKCGTFKLRNFSMRRALNVFSIVVVSVSLALTSISAAEAKPKFSSVVVDARTGVVLQDEDSNGLRHPASLTKMMTLYILFQELKAGRVKLSTPLRVSRRSASMAPSKLGLRAGSTISVELAIKALIIKSANDAAATVGENLAGGNEAAFATRMTRTARSLGMSRTTFKNASGLPNPAQVTTARDMATLGLRLMRDFPQYYPYFRATSFVFNGRLVRGHNRLVGRFPGTDGIKTGYVNASGFNLVTSTKRDNRRLVGVVMGARSSGTRNAHMMTILARAFPKAKAGDTIAALAGSSRGAINPIAKLKSDVAVAETQKPDDDVKLEAADKDLLAAAAEEAANDTSDEAADEAASAEPAVLEAKLDEPKASISDTPSKKMKDPRSLPFAVKPAGKKTDDLAVASLPDGFTVQIGSFKSKRDAQATLGNLRAAEAANMKGKDAYTIAVKKNGKVTYRVLISGFSEVVARKSCATAAKMGKSCAVLTPQG
jgi:D-alanyl-D-alanine carboxypeptidase